MTDRLPPRPAGTRVRIRYQQLTASIPPAHLRATYPPAEHPWVALFLASDDDAVTHVSRAAQVPFAAVSEVRQAG